MGHSEAGDSRQLTTWWSWLLPEKPARHGTRSPLYLYSFVSFVVFLLIYKASDQVIDEEFHLRQGLHYCHGNFSVWDSKITTFPGLYLVSSVFLWPLRLCTVFTLRLISLAALNVTLYLIFLLRSISSSDRSVSAGEVVAIASLPPMYLFGHLYYTDVLSIMAVLAMMLAALRQRHSMAAICGAFSVLVRQTNIVWVGMIFGMSVSNIVVQETLSFWRKKTKKGLSMKDTNIGFSDLLTVVKINLSHPSLLLRQCRLIFGICFGYLTVMAAFVGFVVWNGSIVVGDKSAHEAAIHLPQLFYFNLFTLVFGFGFLPSVPEVKNFSRHHRWSVLLLTIACVLIVRYNTLVHPYLLADNRHYTFYVWNRFYGRYWWARYATVPVFVYATLAVALYLKQQKIPFNVMFVVCSVVQLALQRMIEVRYFLLPFLMLRLRARPWGGDKLRRLELVFNVAVNLVTIYIFCKKEIYWDDYENVQRLIW